jgi:hypothetical protein
MRARSAGSRPRCDTLTLVLVLDRVGDDQALLHFLRHARGRSRGTASRNGSGLVGWSGIVRWSSIDHGLESAVRDGTRVVAVRRERRGCGDGRLDGHAHFFHGAGVLDGARGTLHGNLRAVGVEGGRHGGIAQGSRGGAAGAGTLGVASPGRDAAAAQRRTRWVSSDAQPTLVRPRKAKQDGETVSHAAWYQPCVLLGHKNHAFGPQDT